MLDKLKRHHIGFIVPLEERHVIEERYGRTFHLDVLQRTHVLFVYDSNLRTYIEFICQEGRVAKQPPGFAHVCYELNDETHFAQFEDFMRQHKMGFRISPLEPSGSDECGRISFYFVKHVGVIELNVRG